ncbi:MAG: class I SAM-dependent methyltransferase [Rikenellaceae bacterium]|nr:class I SAM-dependent methyltransferase [Rikenellaceae bacterium]
MGATAERVSVEASDNYVFQRSLLAYHTAAQLIDGVVLEIGTGSGYGIDVVSPRAEKFITIDKFDCGADLSERPNVEFRQMTVPPLTGIADQSVDCVISFQVIEHIKDDVKMVDEVWRVLRPGGRFIVSTPNRLMSLTRNPWHVREYTPEEFAALLGTKFDNVEQMGVFGNAKVMEYYAANRASVERIARWDILDLQHRLPRWILQIPYDILNRMNRRRLLKANTSLTCGIRMDDYRVEAVSSECFDLFYVAQKNLSQTE